MAVFAAAWKPPRPTAWLARRWANWKRRRREMAEVSCSTSGERERLARDIGVSEADFCILARKPAHASALLSQRLDQLQLETADIREVEPQVLQDLQRVCSLCVRKRKCRRDLAARPWSRVWKEYCPNAFTLNALLAERARQRKGPRAYTSAFNDPPRALFGDGPVTLRYAPATIDPVGDSIVQTVQRAPQADRLMVAFALAASALLLLIATSVKLAGL